MLKTSIYLAFYATACAACLAGLAVNAQGMLHHERETRLGDVRQLTFGAENAEAYWSPDGIRARLSVGNTHPTNVTRYSACRSAIPAAMSLVSTGHGSNDLRLFHGGCCSESSSRRRMPPMKPCARRCRTVSRGYVWPIYDTYQIYSAAIQTGRTCNALTDEEPYYDAEATVCSDRWLHHIHVNARRRSRSLPYGCRRFSNVKTPDRCTPGYDGGAFYSHRTVRKSSGVHRRPDGAEALADYQALLLDEGLIRPE